MTDKKDKKKTKKRQKGKKDKKDKKRQKKTKKTKQILFSIYIMTSHSQEYLEYSVPPKCPQLLLND